MGSGKRLCAITLGIVAIMTAENAYATALPEFCTRYARRNTAYSESMNLEPDTADYHGIYPYGSDSLQVYFKPVCLTVNTSTLEITEAALTLYDFTETSEEGQQTYAECIAVVSALEISYAEEILLKYTHKTSDGSLAAMDEALDLLSGKIEGKITNEIINDAVENPRKEIYLCSLDYDYYFMYVDEHNDSVTLKELLLVAKQKQ